MVEAFPWKTAPKYLLRDRDSIYGARFLRRVHSLNMEEVCTAPRSPWQNPFVERLIGSIRRECLNHVIVLNERHLRSILRDYFSYYHTARTHLSLDKQCPKPRAVNYRTRERLLAFHIWVVYITSTDALPEDQPKLWTVKAGPVIEQP